MLLDVPALPHGSTLSADVAIVGAGPAGIVTALELGAAGVDVLLVESGATTFDAAAQRLGDAATYDPERHAPLALATRRQVGGTSTIWGGRCVPYDPVDFDDRAVTGLDAAAGWPLDHSDIEPYYGRACAWLRCGRPVFDVGAVPGAPAQLVPGLVDGDICSTTLERWSLPLDLGLAYRDELRRSRTVRLAPGLTCTRIVCFPGSGRADHLECANPGGRRITVRARRFVVAGGGLGGTRLLMASESPFGGRLGDHSGHLGRWYMAHIEGIVAEAVFTTPASATVQGFETDVDGSFVRRRISFTREFQHAQGLPNIVAWLANPELPDPSHRSGPLSAVYLALRSPLGRLLAPDAQRLCLTGVDLPGTPYRGAPPGPIGRHLANIVREPRATAELVGDLGVRRLLRRPGGPPGFFPRRPDNRYPLQYHGEHLPQRESLVDLSRERDPLGMPRLDIDVRFSDADVEGVVRAHRFWDDHLRGAGVGYLNYLDEDVAAGVRRQLGAGFHQCGTTRMSARPEDGVVDADLAVHGVPNVFVASSSAFPTSSQANSTFLIVAMAVRLAAHLRRLGEATGGLEVDAGAPSGQGAERRPCPQAAVPRGNR
ncbi:GMC oxidoreductase [Actinomycetospora cinnamomea]|uniref:Choline dehydrogenase-like flavoprotein n=1 Tax=Actinomycetospora cinnamomea TaxID=663609 RepID=A0A2U1EXE2_9PSEU|nr:GMC oxidoreductase [Actinomycetospora cinnamomea]PVZ04595.1 choline dehydrogenase-like flavoprotein [Actinomycetospora cinnamomea]